MNVFDYVRWRGDVPLSMDPFNEVDNVVLCVFCYAFIGDCVPADGSEVTVEEVCEKFFRTHSREEIRKSTSFIAPAPLLMDYMIAGSRFAGLGIRHYVNEVEPDKAEQFSAVTYHLSDGTYYVAFRGTDNTVTGWKECFNLSYMSETEGQRRAVEYLNMIGDEVDGPIRVGGHSKGGNFAMYASAFCRKEVQDRIIEVWSNEGPGFGEEVLNSAEYRRIVGRIHRFVTDTSMIGMLFGHDTGYTVVRSSAKGLVQHDANTWCVDKNRFERAELSETSQLVGRILGRWFDGTDNETRGSFTESLFTLFEAAGKDTVDEILGERRASIRAAMAALKDLPDYKRKELRHLIRRLVRISRHERYKNYLNRLRRLGRQDPEN